MCIHTSGPCEYAVLYVLPRYEARGPPDWYVIASQFSMQLMLFRRGLSAIVRNSEVYVISRVVISRFDLYMNFL